MREGSVASPVAKDQADSQLADPALDALQSNLGGPQGDIFHVPILDTVGPDRKVYEEHGPMLLPAHGHDVRRARKVSGLDEARRSQRLVELDSARLQAPSSVRRNGSDIFSTVDK